MSLGITPGMLMWALRLMAADEIFAALADPTRREVLSLVAQGRARTATELAAALPVTRQAVSKAPRDAGGRQARRRAAQPGGRCASTPPRSR